jgi:hypothetical protein
MRSRWVLEEDEVPMNFMAHDWRRILRDDSWCIHGRLMNLISSMDKFQLCMGLNKPQVKGSNLRKIQSEGPP